MPAGKTYEPIATTTLGSASANITFSSIPSTYTDLILVLNVATASAGESVIRFNSSTSGYGNVYMYGNGTSALANNNFGQTVGRVSYGAGSTTTLGNMNYIVQIQSYANTSIYKTYMSRANNASSAVDFLCGQWENTSAITSIAFFYSDSSNIVAGSSATLYGIAAA
jgi:hypothetical protein